MRPSSRCCQGAAAVCDESTHALREDAESVFRTVVKCGTLRVKAAMPHTGPAVMLQQPRDLSGPPRSPLLKPASSEPARRRTILAGRRGIFFEGRLQVPQAQHGALASGGRPASRQGRGVAGAWGLAFGVGCGLS